MRAVCAQGTQPLGFQAHPPPQPRPRPRGGEQEGAGEATGACLPSIPIPCGRVEVRGVWKGTDPSKTVWEVSEAHHWRERSGSS